MGSRFRKSVKLLPGVRLNISKSGVSTSIGVRGASVNVGKRGTRATVGIPGTGISYSERIGGGSAKRGASLARPAPFVSATSAPGLTPTRSVSAALGIGIVVVPYVFAWFTLLPGYSAMTRWLSFGWLGVLLAAYAGR